MPSNDSALIALNHSREAHSPAPATAAIDNLAKLREEGVRTLALAVLDPDHSTWLGIRICEIDLTGGEQADALTLGIWKRERPRNLNTTDFTTSNKNK